MRAESISAISSALLPPPVWFSIVREHSPAIDLGEYFIKQTHRNRLRILSANGVLSLSIPLQKTKSGKIPMGEVQISYAENWPRKHFQAIRSAYGSAPYFEFLQEEFQTLWFSEEKFLADFNRNLLQWAFHRLKMDFFPTESHDYIEAPEKDFRSIDFCASDLSFQAVSYRQVFAERFSFVPHLSIIDLIFNGGDQRVLIG